MLTTQVKELSEKVNQYIDLRAKRLKMEGEAEIVHEQERKVRAEILEALKTSGAGGIAGKTHRAEVVRKTTPQVADWSMLYEYIKENNAFELIQRRLSNPAVKERWDDKVEIPGVVPVEVDDLSVTKL